MSYKVLKILFPRATKQQLEKPKDKGVIFKRYNKTIIPYLGICSISIKHKNKQNLC